MCRAVLETEEGGVKAEAVNDGIMYLMVFPYLLVGILGYMIYRMKTKKKAWKLIQAFLFQLFKSVDADIYFSIDRYKSDDCFIG